MDAQETSGDNSGFADVEADDYRARTASAIDVDHVKYGICGDVDVKHVDRVIMNAGVLSGSRRCETRGRLGSCSASSAADTASRTLSADVPYSVINRMRASRGPAREQAQWGWK